MNDENNPLSPAYKSVDARTTQTSKISLGEGTVKVKFIKKNKVSNMGNRKPRPPSLDDTKRTRPASIIFCFGKHGSFDGEVLRKIFATDNSVLKGKVTEFKKSQTLTPESSRILFLLNQDQALMLELAVKLNVQGLKFSVAELQLKLGNISLEEIALLTGSTARTVYQWENQNKHLGTLLHYRTTKLLFKLLDWQPDRAKKLLLEYLAREELKDEEKLSLKRLRQRI